MSIINNGLLLAAEAAAAGAYEISRSLRFNSADSAYLSRTPASAGNRKTWTVSTWVKRTKLSSFMAVFGLRPASTPWSVMLFRDTDKLEWDTNTGFCDFITTQVFRDTSAWYHIVLAVDSTQATSTDRVKLYVNGVQVTQFDSISYPSLNQDGDWNTAVAHNIGAQGPPTYPDYGDYYQTDFHFIDGLALAASSFGEFDTNGVWQPIAYSGSYGTNGFHLTFSDNSGTTSTTLGKDAAGSNNFTPNNFSVAAGSGNDSLVDVPTASGTDTGAGGEVRGNYATLNPLKTSSTLGNGNLEIASASGGQNTFATFAVSTGKWYWECSGSTFMTGINLASASLTDISTNLAYNSDGQKYTGSSSAGYGASFTSSDTVGVALDLDAGTLVFYKNGTSQGTAFSSLSGTYSPWLRVNSSTTPSFNFGQRPFAYTAPSGFKALCTTNLPTPTIADGSTAMNIQLWTGNSTNGRAITGYGFSPDFVWIKRRSASYANNLFDTVRGIAAGGWAGLLYSDNTAAEDTGNTNTISSFDSDGFTLGIDGGVNYSGSTYVGWAWDAGSSTVTNTSGSISSQVRANASAGFSIVTYTGNGTNGTSVGHGLNVVPGLTIIKRRDSTSTWRIKHGTFANNQNLEGFSTNAVSTENNGAGSAWYALNPTSTIINLGNNADTNASGGTYVAYCFAPVAGYSAFGSWTAATAPVFVYTGFRPAFLLAKSATGSTNYDWFIRDNKRDPYNMTTLGLFPNDSRAERNDIYDGIDFVSNGFVIRASSVGNFSNYGTMVYAAFAEHPFQTARAR